jgi:hypothetical protein
MGLLNLRQQEKNGLNLRTWQEVHPNFPMIRVLDARGVERNEAWVSSLIKCRKMQKRPKKLTDLPGYQLIPLEVCLHSVFRFDPDNKFCRECLGIRRSGDIHPMFLGAQKAVYFKEADDAARTMMDEPEEGKEDENAEPTD